MDKKDIKEYRNLFQEEMVEVLDKLEVLDMEHDEKGKVMAILPHMFSPSRFTIGLLLLR